MLASASPSFETRLTPLLRDEILYLHGAECGNAAHLAPRGHRSSRRDSTQTEHARGKAGRRRQRLAVSLRACSPGQQSSAIGLPELNAAAPASATSGL